jgi:hypothetical protein
MTVPQFGITSLGDHINKINTKLTNGAATTTQMLMSAFTLCLSNRGDRI